MLTRSRFGLFLFNFSKFTTQLWPFVIVRISFPLNILPVKEITLHEKPIPRMCFMERCVGVVSNKYCLLVFLVFYVFI